jgi:hypothetical protein
MERTTEVPMGARKPEVHTTPNASGAGWVNQVAGVVVSTHRIKARAVERGREIAQERATEHAIHNRDGQIARKNSYGGDPNPPHDANR